jgi:hypothetical protein
VLNGTCFLYVLTDHGEIHGVTDGGRGAYLALIKARVPPLRVTNLQHPVFCLGRVDGLKPLVTCVGVAPDGQQMNVSVAHPRHLPNKRRKLNSLSLNRSINSSTFFYPKKSVLSSFSLPNPSATLCALRSTQPVTEMSTRNFPGSKERQVLKADIVI